MARCSDASAGRRKLGIRSSENIIAGPWGIRLCADSTDSMSSASCTSTFKF